jgi:hypothetical protein
MRPGRHHARTQTAHQALVFRRIFENLVFAERHVLGPSFLNERSNRGEAGTSAQRQYGRGAKLNPFKSLEQVERRME